MSKPLQPVLRQRIFEARYEQGYRYLDRCGDAMVVLENLLTEQTGHVWMPAEMVPTGARLECPELDINIVFSTYNLVVDQNPVSPTTCDFSGIASTTLANLVGRFDLRKMRRFGARRIAVLPVKYDSFEEAQRLSLKLAPVEDWRKGLTSPLAPLTCELASVFELPDGSKGVRVATEPYAKIGAEVKPDQRLKLPPHHFPREQRKALLEQLRRAKAREQDPEAGVSIDIDYYWMWPPVDAKVADFLSEAWEESDRLQRVLVER